MSNGAMPAVRQGVAGPAGGVAAPGGAYQRIVPAPAEHVYWLDLQERVSEQSLAACVRGADAVLRLVAFMVPAHIAIVALARTVQPPHPSWAALVLWLFSSAAALAALLPENWKFWPNDVPNIRRNYWAMVRRKRLLTVIAAVLAICGIVFGFVLPAL